MLARWFWAFALTQIVEAPLYVLVLRVWGRRKWRALMLVLIALGASALTHPVVWFVGPRAAAAVGVTYRTQIIASEIFAIMVEGIYLRSCGLRYAMGWSLAINGLSVAAGFALRWATGLV